MRRDPLRVREDLGDALGDGDLRESVRRGAASARGGTGIEEQERRTHLVDHEVGIWRNDGAAREVDALAGQVAAEATLLALEPLAETSHRFCALQERDEDESGGSEAGKERRRLEDGDARSPWGCRAAPS